MSVLEQIRRELGAAVDVREASSAETLDGLVPQAVAIPQDVPASQELIRLCAAQKWSLLPKGGGTQWSTGARPNSLDVLLSTEKLNAVTDHDEGNATITAGAGCSIGFLNETIAPANQYIPFDTPPNSTLGGLAATNFSNAWRGRYGMARDLITGLDVLLSDGRALKTGAKVVKNVSGYDLPKLFIGSRGSLGLITAVTVRLRPRDEQSVQWSRRYLTWEDLEQAVAAVETGPFVPTIFRVVVRQATKTLCLQFDGTAKAVETQVEALDINEDHHFAQIDLENPVVLRLSVPHTGAFGLVRFAQESGAEEIAWDVAPSVLRIHFQSEVQLGIIQAIRQKAETLGGFAVLECGPVDWKTTEIVWGKPPGGLALMRQLKITYDPANIFSPGRFVGGI